MTIEEVTLDEIDELRELWLQLYAHHRSVSPVRAFVDEETSWAVRRKSYVEILGEGGFVLAARIDGDLAGYAAVRFHDGPDDTWDVGDRYAELWTLVVDEARRGEGIGSALLDEVDARLERAGVEGLEIGVVAGNEGALRLYERRGLKPSLVQLMRPARSR
jgi:ribosomal protein S18 acetylase RimI-like enzyme